MKNYTQQEIYQNMTKGTWKLDPIKEREIRTLEGRVQNIAHINTGINLHPNDRPIITDGQAIVSAVNNTYLSGINPEAVVDLYVNLKRIMERIQENNFQSAFPSAYTRALEALEAAKLDIS